jgi:hypothetical protein
MGRPRTTFERIKYKILKSDSGCWIWEGKIHQKTGYGDVCVNFKSTLAHRYVYECLVGEIPKGMQLDHLCKVRACVNPKHLEPVTATENVRRSSVTKLTLKDVNKIKELYSNNHSQSHIAKIYGIQQSSISRIVNNKRWA